MDLISDFFSGPHCSMPQFSGAGTASSAPSPVLRYLSIPMSLKRRGTHGDGRLFFGYLTHFDATFREISEPEKEHVFALKV